MNKNYISVKEYAEKRNCSTSAVYKRMKTTLQPYVEIVDGKQMLKSVVLEVEALNPSSTLHSQPSSTPHQPSTEQSNNEQERDTDNKIISLLEKQIEELKEQLRKQEEQYNNDIDFLKKQIEIKDKQIDQQQQLNAVALKNNLMLTESKEESIIEDNKKGFFKKLFG